MASIVGCSALAVLIVGIFAANSAWHTWHRQHYDPHRNYFAIRAWTEFLDPDTHPGVTAPTLLLSNSQGYGVEWPGEDIYAAKWKRFPRPNVAHPWPLLNWSVAGGLFADQITLAAAAARFQPERIVVVLSPHTFAAIDPVTPRFERWNSDAFFALADPNLRARIPATILDELLDTSLRADILAGAAWPAWRMRRALSDRVTAWLRHEPDSVAAAGIEPYPRQPPPFDPAKAHAYLNLLRTASTNVTMINMPLHSTWRQVDPSAWNALAAICREKGIRAIDFSEAIPDTEFITGSHLNREGHARMARLLHEQVP